MQRTGLQIVHKEGVLAVPCTGHEWLGAQSLAPVATASLPGFTRAAGGLFRLLLGSDDPGDPATTPVCLIFQLLRTWPRIGQEMAVVVTPENDGRVSWGRGA